ncbi:hypothetical protein C8J57DRAFT_1719711, partial [Mycena rebaudengoi]
MIQTEPPRPPCRPMRLSTSWDGVEGLRLRSCPSSATTREAWRYWGRSHFPEPCQSAMCVAVAHRCAFFASSPSFLYFLRYSSAALYPLFFSPHSHFPCLKLTPLPQRAVLISPMRLPSLSLRAAAPRRSGRTGGGDV